MRETLSRRELFDELSFYTLAQPRSTFIHQIAIDTFTAQTADTATRPMALVFALVGLYVHLERGLSGLQVQKIHMQLANRRIQWPALSLPRERGTIEVADVLQAAPGQARDAMLERWSVSVWQAWQDNREAIANLLRNELDFR